MFLDEIGQRAADMQDPVETVSPSNVRHGFVNLGSDERSEGVETNLEPRSGRRGYRTLVPPPPGCVGWGDSTGSSNLPKVAEPEVPEQEPDLPEPPTQVQSKIQSEIEPEAHTDFNELDDSPKNLIHPRFTSDLEIVHERIKQEATLFHMGPAKNKEQLQAATLTHIEKLKQSDPIFANILEDDACAIDLDADTQGAFKIYCSSLGAFDPEPQLKKLAFQAVMRDDVTILSELIASGSADWDIQNRGGQTLLDLASDQGKIKTREVLVQRKEEATGTENPTLTCDV